MRILILWPPQIPSYFNAGHHLPLFQVAAYLRKRFPEAVVTAIDAGALNFTWKEIGDCLVQGRFDIIVLMNDFDAVDGFGRFLRYVKEISSRSRSLTFGRLSKQVPGFFRRYPLNAIVESGDYEAGVSAFVDFCLGKTEEPAGVSLHQGDRWVSALPGHFLPPEEWVFPDIDEIPYAAYESLYKQDQNKFCGIPERRELVVPVMRGCPVGCYFCDVPAMQGREERRVPVGRVIAYIEDCFQKIDFEYVAFYAPTFTLNKRWVGELCDALIQKGSQYPWKCSTTLYHLDELLVKKMSSSGCVRISVGLETLERSALEIFPKIKQSTVQRLTEVGEWCRRYQIELNCFVVLGLPGETAAGARETLEAVRQASARVRPTMYTSYDQLRPDMTEEEVGDFNRHFVPRNVPPEEAQKLYEMIFSKDPYLTHAMKRIPKWNLSSTTT